MQKWEYKIFYMGIGISPGELERCEQELDRLGTEGWELVALSGIHFFFKRPKS